MHTFRAEAIHAGGTRMYSFYTKRDRDEFVAADPDHRKKMTYRECGCRIKRYRSTDKYDDGAALLNRHPGGKTPSHQGGQGG